MMLVDSHCHLDFPDFASELDDVVMRARDAGVTVMQTISTRLSRFAEVRAIAEAYDGIYCSAGVHPHHVAEEGIWTACQITAFADCPHVIGIGETGLDYYYDDSPRDAQRQSFREHIRASRSSGLPLIVHTRSADDDTMAILEEETNRDGAFPGLIHCFSASRDLAQRSLRLGFFISISGIVTFRNASGLRDIVRDVPVERLLVETDAPFLAPVPKRGKRNEPGLVVHTARCVAELKELSQGDLAQITTDNFFRLFSNAQRT